MSWYVVHGFYFLCLLWFLCIFFFFKQKTAYEMRISDWSSDVCSSDLLGVAELGEHVEPKPDASLLLQRAMQKLGLSARGYHRILKIARTIADLARNETVETRSEEHPSELQSLMRISYDVFCSKNKIYNTKAQHRISLLLSKSHISISNNLFKIID